MPKSPSTILFIHGWATDTAVWDDQVRRFGGSFDILNMNLPGHGGEQRWAEPTLDAALREVERRVKGLKDGSVIGIGWSLGAQVLIETAVRHGAKFNSLVLVGATPCFVRTDGFPWGQPRALVKRMVLDMKKDPVATLKRFYALNFTEGESGTEGVRGFIGRYAPPGPGPTVQPGCAPSFSYAEVTTALEALYNTDIRGSLAKINVPALVIHGERDGVCPVKAGLYLASNLRNAELKVFNGSGHGPFITRPAEFHEAVMGFIARL
ncbi:MAG: alpha/beta fold hydrolase [Deltaproteobacteria bacterium]|nr:alpha/beta fold hydrolase [Deltaproteobacteria bacterium]